MDETLTGASAYRPRPIAGDLAGRHIVSVEQFARPDLDALFADASRLRARTRVSDASVRHLCAGMVLGTLFYEASTRTRARSRVRSSTSSSLISSSVKPAACALRMNNSRCRCPAS